MEQLKLHTQTTSLSSTTEKTEGQEAKALMMRAVEALQDKKARNIVVLDISRVTTVARYFVISSGTSTTHIKALADGVEEKLDREGIPAYRRSGYNSARWVLLDYSDVVVHVFHEEDRIFYGLERLWQDGQRVSIPQADRDPSVEAEA